MAYDPLTTVASIGAELEAGWKRFDDIYDAFTPAQWQRKFGRTWTYAEQPYHLAYFDATFAKYAALGPDAPPDRLHLRTMRAINEWNAQEFAKRGDGYSAAQAVAEMRKSRDAVRGVLATAAEADLDRKAWMPLLMGWNTVRGLMHAIVLHNVAEYWKLWIRTGKRASAPSPDAVHLRLGFMMSFMPATLNRELAKTTPFTAGFNFIGPGGGSWTLRVADGECTVSEAPAANPNLTMTMTPEDFHVMSIKMTPAPILLLTGRVKIKGFGAMGTFGKLFREPGLDDEIDTGLVG